ncbi:MAG: metallophosphoesterase family protein [Clostridia bacterium]
MEQIKVGIFTDTHANLPALENILKEFKLRGMDEIIHLGDVLSMGAYPKECMEILLKNPQIQSVRGNHDDDYLKNITLRRGFSHVPPEHKEYEFRAAGDDYRPIMEKLPYVINKQWYERKFTFMHYARFFDEKIGRERFYVIEENPTPQKLDEMFKKADGEVVFFGHKHSPMVMEGERLYIDVGSLGCHKYSYARAIILTVKSDRTYTIERIKVPYDRQKLLDEMDKKQIPGREEMKNFYFAGE